MTTTAAGAPGTTDRATTTAPALTTDPGRRRVSARIRILLWLLLVMAVALATVAMTTRSFLLRDVDNRINRLLTQETGEFANFEERGGDPRTGRPFTDADRLLTVFLERQNPDADEELIGLVRGANGTPRQIRQRQDLPVALPLHEDPAAKRGIFDSAASSGVLHRPEGEIRWAKVTVAQQGREPEAAFVVAFHPQREQARVNSVFRTLLVISGVALLLTVGIAWAVAGRILKPVRVVRTAAAQLTEQDLTRRIPVHGNDDIAALAETFNGMLDRLERAFAAQREFVDDAGHELRTPITIVRGHLEVMGDDPAEREETVRLVTDELDRMSRIVEDLLLLAKAERPDFVSPEPVQVAELTADVYVKARTLGDRDWQLAEVADLEAGLDPQRITQAMVQLAQNAVQHTTSGQTIRIGSRTDGPRLELYVADSGPGVQPQDTEVIFERFRRGTARRGARGSGAGLGLSIVKAIAEGHRGRVRLRDTPGGGATFALVLHAPRAPEGDHT
ncbi:sensor histidine kinase [Streptomyces afghaniensis]|uniref:sensor histidine kinase n=1 Tax=Streptomyces afghaniensis TaxID=66865 RepID=UPI0027854FF5|nr:ATP-binding protein [Streptomyces afghaniensis]MDQ1020207.1 two-component system OmpR family sensor kinase [Streptomyces afghaniensis]